MEIILSCSSANTGRTHRFISVVKLFMLFAICGEGAGAHNKDVSLGRD